MVHAIAAFLEFCYLVRHDTIDEDTLKAIGDALDHYHHEREIFITTDIRKTISLPCQHAMKHDIHLICLFGSPNGLCSSMMEAKHIIAVKRPYRRSSKNKALGQIIKTNQRLDQLGAFHVHLDAQGMLDGPCPRLDALLHHIHRIEHHNELEDSDSSDESGIDSTHRHPQEPCMGGTTPGVVVPYGTLIDSVSVSIPASDLPYLATNIPSGTRLSWMLKQPLSSVYIHHPP